MSYVLGLDTSNYTTSAALIDKEYKIVCDRRKAIKVKEGMKGIRQSEALFQHIENLPELLDDILREYAGEIRSVCASTRPRPVNGSYMPVFKAGTDAGKLICASLNIVFLETSHQEGHIAAGMYPDFVSNGDIAVFHLSGGTTEILVGNEIIGGTKDISIGQMIDRMGVEAGFSFPAGPELDDIALKGLKDFGSYEKIKEYALEKFKYIARDGYFINLSGIDSQIKRIMEAGAVECEKSRIITAVFYLISHCLKALTTDIKKQYNISNVLFVGGVSSSKFVRGYLKDMEISFARPDLSADNAVGAAIIGGRKTWL